MNDVRIDKRHRGRELTEFIALLPGVQDAVAITAADIAVDATALLMDHHVENIAHIEVLKGDVDRYVSLVDSNVTNEESASNNSALSIELGRAGYIDQHGKTYGEMEGLYILSRAAGVQRKRGRIAKIRRPRNDARRDKRGRFLPPNPKGGS